MSSTIVKIKSVSKIFMGVKVLDNISLDIAKDDKIAMMGPNGAGKTTLVRSILGFYHIDSGKILVKNKEPIKHRQEVLKDISFIPQLPPPIKLTLSELLDFVHKSTNTSIDDIKKEAKSMDLDISNNLKKPFFKLSGGMKQKLLIAIALARKSSLMIFDEPTASLDPKAREKFYNLLNGIDREFAAIYITHRAEELEGLVNRHIYMDLGKVVEDERV